MTATAAGATGRTTGKRIALGMTLIALLLVVFALTYWPWMGYMTKVM